MVDYDAWLRVGLSIDIVSGFVFLAFGAFAAFKRPRTRAGQAVGMFALGWALVGIYPNWHALVTGEGGRANDVIAATPQAVNTLGFTVVAIGILWLARVLCRGWPRSRIGDLILLITAATAVWVAYNSWNVSPDFAPTMWRRVTFTASNVLAANLSPLLIWFALSIPDDERGTGWLAFAVTPLAGAWFLTNGVDFAREMRPAQLMPLMFMMALGLVALSGRRRPKVLAWTVAWWLLAFGWGWALAGHRPNDLGLIGVTRLLAVGIMVYAVVRHRAFDIDVKLRFTLRQSTVAAIFVAVFIAVQSGVSEFVTSNAGIVAGAAATALLVFALGPIQRLAERVAANAMPQAVPLDQRAEDDRAKLFEALAREAWSDGNINAKEARVLETAWRRLGLSADQAAGIEGRVRS